MTQKKVPVVLLTTAAAAWAFIAEQAQTNRKTCGYADVYSHTFIYFGLCAAVGHLQAEGRITEGLEMSMLHQLEETFRDDARTEADNRWLDYFWTQDKKGWEQRVIAAQLLSEMSKDEGI